MEKTHPARLELEETWHRLGIDPHAIELRSGTAFATMAKPTAPHLPSLLAAPTPDVRPQLELGAVLGEGGMGVVRAATQTALEREVAVKLVREERADEGRGSELLREGRVIGLVEHPNVVPVHAIGQDASGRPILVMKRIEGTAWSDELREASPEARASGDYLRKHLGVLGQIAGALDLAHARGILHRDVKPDNVMLGAFGEVYLVDWGIAVTLPPRALPGVPSIHDVRGIEGTPGYLAPEMARGDGTRLGVWSDVYLLGATLHHVITGAPPHEADSIVSALYAAMQSDPPSYAPEVPEELAAIARRAMARDPEARYPSASAFGGALEAFLSHRESLELSEAGEDRAEEHARLIAAGAAPGRVEEAFHEARFAFEQALRGWPENARARAGREALLAAMIVFELDRDAAQTAATLLRQCEAPARALAERVAAAQAAARAKRDRLASLERDVDLRFGRAKRVRAATLSGAAWAIACFAAGALTRRGIYDVDHATLATVGAVTTVVAAAAAWANRTVLLANTVNRVVSFATMLVFALGALLEWLLGHIGVSMAHTTAVVAILTGAVWTTIAFTLGPARLPMAVGSGLVAVGAFLWPDYHFEAFGLLSVALVLTVHLMSSREAPIR